jgi:hypothetical protein
MDVKNMVNIDQSTYIVNVDHSTYKVNVWLLLGFKFEPWFTSRQSIVFAKPITIQLCNTKSKIDYITFTPN